MVHARNNLLELLRNREPKLAALLGNIAIESSEVIEDIGRREPDPERRRKFLETTRPCWEALELPIAARRAIERLEDPRTRIVIAGQQYRRYV